MKKVFLGLLTATTILGMGCKSGGGEEAQKSKQLELAEAKATENNAKLEKLNHDYGQMPDARMLDNNGEKSAVYAELKVRYKAELTKLKQDVEATGAKFVMIILTPEVGSGVTNISRFGHPFIKATCAELGIECIDLSPEVGAQDPKVITQAPRDGHWSKKGAEFVANLIAPVIKKNSDATCKATYKDAERPETFGDLPPNDDEIMDGGKDLPYHVKANAQGVRMDYNLTFPKKKKRILLMGDSGIFCPFLDNEFTIPGVLQKTFPDYEIMNTGMICYTVDDYVSLFNEKAKFAEPDLVILQANGGDITDLFFTNRNHLGRSHRVYVPTETELKYYNEKLGAGLIK